MELRNNLELDTWEWNPAAKKNVPKYFSQAFTHITEQLVIQELQYTFTSIEIQDCTYLEQQLDLDMLLYMERLNNVVKRLIIEELKLGNCRLKLLKTKLLKLTSLKNISFLLYICETNMLDGCQSFKEIYLNWGNGALRKTYVSKSIYVLISKEKLFIY